MKKYLKLAFIIFLSVAVFLGSSYFYLEYNLKKSEKTVDEKLQNIPYSNPPENCGILFKSPSGNSVLFFLDFEQIILYIININTDVVKSDGYVGYPIDYKCTTEYYTLSLFFDRIGGIDYMVDEQMRRLSGIQVCDMLLGNNSSEVSFKVIDAVCDKLSKTGLSSEDFVFLIENCETDLTMPVCIYWQEYISQMFSGRVFVNWES